MFYEFRNIGDSEYFRIDTENNMIFLKHIHHSFEIISVTGGSMEVTVDSDVYDLTAGDALLVFPDQVHSLESEKSEHITYIFSPLLVNAYYSALSGKVPANAKFRISGGLLSSLASLTPDSPLIRKKGVLYSVCAEFDEGTEYVSRSVKSDPFFEIFSFIEENYLKECTLRDAARNIGMNYSYVSRSFKKLVGMSFNEYVNQMRLNRATYLLESTGASVVECALESGFNSAHTFNRNFRDKFGMTPSEYRNKTGSEKKQNVKESENASE